MIKKKITGNKIIVWNDLYRIKASARLEILKYAYDMKAISSELRYSDKYVTWFRGLVLISVSICRLGKRALTLLCEIYPGFPLRIVPVPGEVRLRVTQHRTGQHRCSVEEKLSRNWKIHFNRSQQNIKKTQKTFLRPPTVVIQHDVFVISVSVEPGLYSETRFTFRQEKSKSSYPRPCDLHSSGYKAIRQIYIQSSD